MAISRIIGYRKIVGRNGTGKNRQVEIAQFDFAAQRLRQFLLQHRAKMVGIDQECSSGHGCHQQGHQNAENDRNSFHGWSVLPSKRAIMTDSRKLSAGICGLLLAGALAALWWT